MAYLRSFEHRSPLRDGLTRHQLHQRCLVTVILRLRPGRLFVRCFLLLRLLLEASLPHASLLVKSSGFMEFFSLDLLSASGFGRGSRLTCRAELKARAKKLKHSVVGQPYSRLLLGREALCDRQKP